MEGKAPHPEKEKMIRRVMLTVAYDGTAYSGFALQKTSPRPTIEGTLNHALHALTGEEIECIGASRTDAGVHALGNVAVFDTASPIPGENFANALHPLLPQDIRIASSCTVPRTFHPRHVESRKTYEYHILCGPYDIPTMQRYVYRVPTLLNVGAMEEAAACLIGTHDFTSFCNVQTQSENRVRKIDEILMKNRKVADIPYAGEFSTLHAANKDAEHRENTGFEEITLRITGNGFLYHMVRIITGTLVKIGMGKMSPEEMQGILEAKDRRKAGPTAPPGGLILVGYRFLEGLEDIPKEKQQNHNSEKIF